jgi:uncharacterized HAD superfamily protein
LQTLGESAKKTKADICETLHADIMIEDAPTYAADCAQRNIHVLLYDRPWNRDIPETEIINRVRTWEEVLAKVKQKNGESNLQ